MSRLRWKPHWDKMYCQHTQGSICSRKDIWLSFITFYAETNCFPKNLDVQHNKNGEDEVNKKCHNEGKENGESDTTRPIGQGMFLGCVTP